MWCPHTPATPQLLLLREAVLLQTPDIELPGCLQLPPSPGSSGAQDPPCKGSWDRWAQTLNSTVPAVARLDGSSEDPADNVNEGVSAGGSA